MLSVRGQRAGGMVISDRWILTAAHVLESEGVKAASDSVRVGQRSSPKGERLGQLLFNIFMF